jgi:hypothetical protein
MRIPLALFFGGALLCGGIVPSVAKAKTVCAHAVSHTGDAKQCSNICTNVSADIWVDGWKKGYAQPIPPATTLPPAPTTITSCKAVVTGPDSCDVTYCGPENASYRDSVTPFRQKVTGPANGITPVPPCGGPGNPCPRKSSTVVGPGLLEGDSGFTQQAPAAAGTAAPTAPAPTAPTGGRGTVVYSRP